MFAGNRGILKSNGLTIAYIGGVDGETIQGSSYTTYTPDDVQFIRDSCMKHHDFKGVDVLLTYEWPADVGSHDRNTLVREVSDLM